MWIIATLAGLAGLIIFFLCVPLDAVFQMDVYGRPKFRLRLVWLFGIISKELRKKKKPKEVVEGKPKRRAKRIRARTIFQILKTRGLIRQIKNLLSDVLGQLKLRELVVNLRMGLDDPADTGFLFAVIGSATPFLNSFSPCQVRVRPSIYGETVCEGYLRGRLRLRPIQLVTPVFRFIFSLAMLRVAKVWILSKWKRKK